MFGFGNKRKKMAIDMLVTELVSGGMHNHLAKIMATKMINGVIGSFNKKMPFHMIIIMMAVQVYVETLLEEDGEQDKPLIEYFQDLLSRYSIGLQKIYDQIDDYDKEVLSGIELTIKHSSKIKNSSSDMTMSSLDEEQQQKRNKTAETLIQEKREAFLKAKKEKNT
tara:strand:- start:47 stop:544 length:498 start_codon:yes stop_codon:yes gene_type:complete